MLYVPKHRAREAEFPHLAGSSGEQLSCSYLSWAQGRTAAVSWGLSCYLGGSSLGLPLHVDLPWILTQMRVCCACKMINPHLCAGVQGGAAGPQQQEGLPYQLYKHSC